MAWNAGAIDLSALEFRERNAQESGGAKCFSFEMISVILKKICLMAAIKHMTPPMFLYTFARHLQHQNTLCYLTPFKSSVPRKLVWENVNFHDFD